MNIQDGAWYGAFPEFQVDRSEVYVDWPNLYISAARLRSLVPPHTKQDRKPVIEDISCESCESRPAVCFMPLLGKELHVCEECYIEWISATADSLYDAAQDKPPTQGVAG